MDTTQKKIRVSRLQHHVFFVRSLEEAREFYTDIFDLNFSADNSPTSSAAMFLIGQSMNFYSFGYYHHDLCFVHNPKFEMKADDDMLHITLELAPEKELAELEERLNKRKHAYKKGRLLASQDQSVDGLHFQDPSGNLIEVIKAA